MRGFETWERCNWCYIFYIVSYLSLSQSSLPFEKFFNNIKRARWICSLNFYPGDENLPLKKHQIKNVERAFCLRYERKQLNFPHPYSTIQTFNPRRHAPFFLPSPPLFTQYTNHQTDQDDVSEVIKKKEKIINFSEQKIISQSYTFFFAHMIQGYWLYKKKLLLMMKNDAKEKKLIQKWL